MTKSFENLEIWQLSVKLAEKIYKLTNNFPKGEKYDLISQIKRSSVSVSANIAEAFGRFHYKDKKVFLYNARGSLLETKSHLLLSSKLFKLTNSTVNELISDINILGIKLNNFIKTIGKHNK